MFVIIDCVSSSMFSCRKPVKELLDLEFFAEWGVQVEGKLTDDPDVIQFMIKYDAKKRKDMHKKDEAIQFDFNIVKDDPTIVVKEMVCLLQIYCVLFITLRVYSYSVVR